MIFSGVVAMIAAHSALSAVYEGTLGVYLTVKIGGEGLTKPLIHWISDGMMGNCFLLIGLELKKELLEGKLENAPKFFCLAWRPSAAWSCPHGTTSISTLATP